MGAAQNLTKGQDGLGQPVIIWDRTQEGTVQGFDSLSCGTKWDRAEKQVILKQERDVLKQENEVLKQENEFLKKMKF